MTLFPRDINIDQLGVRSLFGCLFVYVTQEKAYKLVSFSARKMFLYFFLHRIYITFIKSKKQHNAAVYTVFHRHHTQSSGQLHYE